MKIIDILREEKDEAGVYISIKPTVASAQDIEDFLTEHNIPMPVPQDKLHVTILSSVNPVPGLAFSSSKIEPPVVTQLGEYKVYESPPSEEKNGTRCLVVQLDSPQINEMHQHYLDTYDAEHLYGEFQAHITLSYDIGDMMIDQLPQIKNELTQVAFDHLSVEQYQKSWSDNLKQ